MGNIQNNSEEPGLVFSQENAPDQENEYPSHLYDPGIAFPLMIIAVGIFQYILRKWLAPISDEEIIELEEKIPTQRLIYLPQFGFFLISIGVILLVILNY
jgi:hypothetical protein